MTPRPLLLVDRLSVSIGDAPIIRQLSFRVDAGEIVGLAGASGSGKSMTALAIMRLLPPRARLSGAVYLNGAAITTKSEAELRGMRGRDIGMVFQEPMTALNPLMQIGDQVAETVLLHGAVSRRRANTLAREALDAVGLEGEAGALNRYPYELSGGQRQRVAIAIAVVLRPALLIADEPTTALDVIAQAHILALLRELVTERRMGLILVSHDLAVIARIADRLTVMNDGKIVEERTLDGEGPAQIRRSLRHLRHPYTRALLAAAELPVKRADDATAAGEHTAPPVLEVRGLIREYRRSRRSLWHARTAIRAVDDVSLNLRAGENVGLVGESGSGKSSLLRAILALDRPQGGDVRLLGEPFSTATGANLRRLRRSIQLVFQDPYGSFDPQWPVERLISEPYYLMDAPPSTAERRRRVAEVLEQVGLAAADGLRYPHEFSGGQRQRIAIARALITEPAIIAFDEAVSALDVLIRAQILDLLVELSSRLKLAYLFVSHDLNVVRAIADRVYVMQRGRIVEHGPTAELFSSPQHEYTRALIAATSQLNLAWR
ncbi:MAG: peptide/nickel transport system ATP-binding protein ddpF, partial [Gammaproteobacteria bacterium]|jgi:peptide/nickel transport system ATP-binding protein|nr:peptide/nickel transport system ATP-binding protein ddpF [Gammaproteobacteria bacterium]